MCGVVGIYAYHESAPLVDINELRKIRDHMAPRGPDGLGEWLSDNGRTALGHRRLSILDLSDNARQPMVSNDGSLVISFNGEIYNYKALRVELEKKGYHFRSESDTEVLLYMYAESGIAMLNELRGMFAFSLWDANKQALLLARDPYGIKPLYYANNGQTVHLASQVKALLTSSRISKTTEPAGIVGFYLFGSVPEPFTIFQDIRSVPAGHYIWIDKNGLADPEQYFSLTDTFGTSGQSDLNKDNLEEIIHDALLDSVRHHMVADVPVGAFLSAGIDSGALVGLMSDMKGQTTQPVQTITIAFEEFRGRFEDESPLAEKVARKFGTQHTTRIVSKKEFEADLPHFFNVMDQPTIDGINTWFASKAANELGLKVAISGLGGDELFGGYPSFRDIPRWIKLFSIPSRIPFLGDTFCKALNNLVSSSRIHPKAAGLLKYGGYWYGAYLLKRGLFMPWELPDLIGKEFAIEGLERLNWEHHVKECINGSSLTSFAKIAILESSLYMRNQLLRDTDWTGMAHSLEIRTPLVDAALLKNIVPLLINNNRVNKTLLTNSLSSRLPSDVINRSKTGFLTPVPKWMSTLQSCVVKNSLVHNINGQSIWSREWGLYVIRNTLDAL